MIVIFFFLFLCGSVKLPLITDYSLRFENFCCRAAFCCNLVTMKIWTNCDVRNKLKPGKKSFFWVCCCPWNVILMKQLCAQKYYIFTGCCIHNSKYLTSYNTVMTSSLVSKFQFPHFWEQMQQKQHWCSKTVSDFT